MIPPFDVREYAEPAAVLPRLRARPPRRARSSPSSGLPEGARVRLATMDAYDGTVYNVSDEGAGSSSAFGPVRGEHVGRCRGHPGDACTSRSARCETVWMPDVGAVTSVDVRRRPGRRPAPLRVLQRGDRDRRRDGGARARATRTRSTSVAPARAQRREPRRRRRSRRCGCPKQEGVPRGPRRSRLQGRRRGDDADRAGAGAAVHAARRTASSATASRARRSRAPATAPSASRRCSAPTRWSATTSSTPPRWRCSPAQLGIPARVVMGFYPDEDAAGDAGLHRQRRHAPRVGRGRVRGRRLGAVRSHAARGPGAERPDHEAAGRPEAAGAAAAAARRRSPSTCRRRCPTTASPRTRRMPAPASSASSSPIGAGALGLHPAARRAVPRDRRAEGGASSPPASRCRARGRPDQRRLGRARRPRRRLRHAGASRRHARRGRAACSARPSPSRRSRRSPAAPTPRSSVRPSRRPTDVEEFWRQVDEIVGGMGSGALVLGTRHARASACGRSSPARASRCPSARPPRRSRAHGREHAQPRRAAVASRARTAARRHPPRRTNDRPPPCRRRPGDDRPPRRRVRDRRRHRVRHRGRARRRSPPRIVGAARRRIRARPPSP